MQHHQTKADPTKKSWEASEFPILCETCLGDNPYVRMTKEAHGSACKVCERPFTVFRWKPGPKARYKSTVVCQMCSKMKNTCQCCILDLQYGVPVEVRDKYFAQAAAASGGVAATSALVASHSSVNSAVSDVNRTYAMMRAEEQMEQGGVVPYSGAAAMYPQAHEQLLRLGRNKPYYERNMAKLCSFFAKGECNRGDECPFRHIMPRDKDDPLAKQNIKDRYFGTDDPVAAKMMGRLNGTDEDGDGSGAGRGGGSGHFSNRMPEPPSDPTVTTVWVAGLDERVTEEDLRSSFLPYGGIKSIRVLPAPKSCAFIDFIHRGHAESAVSSLFNSLTLHNLPLRVAWAKPKGGQQGRDGSDGATDGYGASSAPIAPSSSAASSSSAAASGSGSNAYPSAAPGAGAGSAVAQAAAVDAAAASAVPVGAGDGTGVAPWAAAMHAQRMAMMMMHAQAAQQQQQQLAGAASSSFAASGASADCSKTEGGAAADASSTAPPADADGGGGAAPPSASASASTAASSSAAASSAPVPAGQVAWPGYPGAAGGASFPPMPYPMMMMPPGYPSMPMPYPYPMPPGFAGFPYPGMPPPGYGMPGMFPPGMAPQQQQQQQQHGHHGGRGGGPMRGGGGGSNRSGGGGASYPSMDPHARGARA